jgi:hypothetical protein
MDNELAYLESLHLFVEILDHLFSDVCELEFLQLPQGTIASLALSK